jgi:twitching motility protein PilT
MQLDVQWFIAALVSEELMTREDCLKVLETVGLEADISEVAQEALNLASQSVSEDEAEELLEPFETAAEYAVEQAESGEQLPEDYSLSLFGELLKPEPVISEPPKPSTPDLSKILADPGTRSESSGEHKSLPSLPKPKLDGLKPSNLKAELGSALPGLGAKPAIPMNKPAIQVNKAPVQPPPADAGEELGIKEEEKVKSLPASQIRPTDYAIQIAINNAFPREVSGNWAGLMPFEAVSSLEGEELRDFMLGLLREVRQRGASDLHISSLSYPFARRNGLIETISDHIVTPDEAFKMNTILLNKSQYNFYEENKDISYALQVDASNRFRVCLITHKDGAAGSYRLVSEELKSLTELGFSEKNTKTIENFLDFHNGLILVTGPIGSGKTTTLASMVNIINEKRHDHVITVEDPIEIVQYSKGCNVTQRELRAHTSTYKAALKGALREDPDVIIIGELHDLETIEMAITASETGHLVIGTLHTCDAANTLNRLLDVFPPSQQPQIRAMTAGSLRGIVCQKLLPSTNGGMTVAAEILVNTTAVQNIISDGRTHHLKATIQTGQNAGMTTMDNSVLELYQRGEITRATAERNIRASDVKQEFKRVVAIEEAKKLSGN